MQPPPRGDLLLPIVAAAIAIGVLYLLGGRFAFASSPLLVASDELNLDRFINAQASCYDSVLAELAAGKKRTHWMWYIFPQHHGLGRSVKAKHFGIKSRDEAAAYLRHPLLGRRLRECVEAVLRVSGASAFEIFGPIDEVKLRASLTLFDAVAERGDDLFQRALAQFYGGQADDETLRLLRAG